MEPDDLMTLATRHKCDKWNSHWYARHYDFHFSRLRQGPVRLLEIGVGGYSDSHLGGESLRMWRDFFPQGTIVGLDICDKSALAEERIHIYQGDQSDPKVLQRMIDAHGPFDLIIDDGSHRSEHVIATFEYLFRHGLKLGGIYAVEDLQTSYWTGWGGQERIDATGTSMAYLKEVCDRLNWREWHRPGYSPTYVDQHVVSAHFYHNLVFVYKGENSEESNFVVNNVVPPNFRRSRRREAKELLKRSLRAALSVATQRSPSR